MDLCVHGRIQQGEPIAPGEEASAVAHLVQTHIIDHWEAQDEPQHLRTIRDRVLSDAQTVGRVLGLYQQVLQQGAMPLDGTLETMALRLSGLVVPEQSLLKPYNPISQAIFTPPGSKRCWQTCAPTPARLRVG